MAGVYLVAAELAQRGFIATPTARSARGVDLLVADPDGLRTYAVEVKTNRVTFGFWLLGAGAEKLQSSTLVYALVNIRRAGPEFHLVPSRVIARYIRIDPPTSTRKATWRSIALDPYVRPFRDNWSVFVGRGARPRFD